MSVIWTSAAWSWPLLLVVAAGAIFLTVRFYGQSRPHPSEGLRRTLVILRSTALLMLVLAVAGPIFSRIFKEDVPGQLVFLLEDSASMNLESSSSETTRWNAALGVAAKVDSALNVQGLDIDVRLLRGNGLGELLEFSADDAVIVDPLNHGTDLNNFLEKAGTRLSADPVRAVVLLTDGQETVSRDADPAGFSVLSGVELLIGGVGDPLGSSDRLIKDIRHAETAFAGDRVSVEVTVLQRLADAATDQPLTAFLKQGDLILDQKTVEAGSGATNLELSFIPGEKGLQMLEVEVSPLGNERFLANNRVSLGIDVHKARARVLVLAERPGWNVRFLAQAAATENRLAMEVVYAAERGLVFADSLTPFEAPGTVAQWLDFDGVILAGWSGRAGTLDYTLLSQAVDAGLGLMVLPDLQENSRGRLKTPVTGLMDLLPVVMGKAKWERGPLFARPDSLAFDHPVFSGLDIMPGMKPLAETPPLRAVVKCSLREGSRTLLVALHNEIDPHSGVPLLVVGNRQDGRIAFWSGSRLWEMAFWEKARSGPESSPEHTVRRILRNLLVWLADGNRESGLSFSGRRAFYQEGETIRLSAQWRDMRGQPVMQGRLSLEIGKAEGFGGSSEKRSFPTVENSSTSGTHDFLLPAMPPGRYSIQLMGHGDSVVEGPVEELIVTSHSVEQTQVRQDGRRLRQLADAHGGTYLNLHEASALEGLMARLAAADWQSSLDESRRQWNPSSGWPFLMLIVLLLACEWFLRRRHGLL